MLFAHKPGAIASTRMRAPGPRPRGDGSRQGRTRGRRSRTTARTSASWDASPVRGVRAVAHGDPWEPWDLVAENGWSPRTGAILSWRRMPTFRPANRPFQGLQIGARLDPGLPRVALGYGLDAPIRGLSQSGIPALSRAPRFVGNAQGVALGCSLAAFRAARLHSQVRLAPRGRAAASRLTLPPRRATKRAASVRVPPGLAGARGVYALIYFDTEDFVCRPTRRCIGSLASLPT